MPIEAAFDGRLGGAPVKRLTEAGKTWLALSVAVSVGRFGDDPEWVSVAVFGDLVDELPGDLSKGERLYVEGKLKLNRWAPEDGDERANLQVAASRILVLDRIGRRRRPKRVNAPDLQAPLSGGDPMDGPIPLASNDDEGQEMLTSQLTGAA